jgi:hypothetical protein
MSDDDRQELGLLATFVIALAIALILAGVVWYGVTLAVFERIGHDLAQRPSRPMSFRFILQPSMAAIAAIHDGLKDARRGRSPYFWTVVSKPEERVARLREGLNATARIILLGLAMDVVYQLIVLETFYPVEALIIALVLAFLPYLALRGLVLRIALVARGRRGGGSADQVR